jgi:hypothetical protein
MQADYEDLSIDADEKFRITLVNNTVLYVLAYTFVWAIHEFVKIALSQYLHLRGNWDVSKIVYTMADNEWWRLAIIAVNGIGPFVCATIAFVAYTWYWRRLRASRGLFKLLVLWISFHALNLSLGALLADNFTQTGFWFVPSWVFQMGNVPNVIVGILAGIGQIAMGYFAGVPFLQAHDSKTVMRYQNRRRMVMYTLILPYIFGTIAICVSRLPLLSLGETIRLVTMILLVGPMCLGCLNELFGSTVRGPKNTHVAWGMLGLSIILLMLWRLFLAPAIHFGG